VPPREAKEKMSMPGKIDSFTTVSATRSWYPLLCSAEPMIFRLRGSWLVPKRYRSASVARDAPCNIGFAPIKRRRDMTTREALSMFTKEGVMISNPEVRHLE
jgi:hypothetical protein